VALKIHGMDGLSQSELDFELQRGAKFVLFQYCVSVVVLTFKRPSGIYFIRSGQSAARKGLPFTLLSLVAGWWGFPWGPVYTLQSVYNNLQGGKDVTQPVRNSLRESATLAPKPSPATDSLLANSSR
jgi:hypothetical protein